MMLEKYEISYTEEQRYNNRFKHWSAIGQGLHDEVKSLGNAVIAS